MLTQIESIIDHPTLDDVQRVEQILATLGRKRIKLADLLTDQERVVELQHIN